MKKMPEEQEDWSDYKKFVLYQLEQYESEISDLDDKITNLAVVVSSLKVKVGQRAAMWGILGGALPVVAYVLIRLWG
jgi:hypothetical protein